MKQELLDEFKEHLLKEKVGVEQELAMVANPDVGDHVPGNYDAKFPNYGEENYLDPDSDSPDEVQAYEVNLAVKNDLEKRLNSINSALERIANGTYGKDLQTGADISVERLRANPEAETAIL